MKIDEVVTDESIISNATIPDIPTLEVMVDLSVAPVLLNDLTPDLGEQVVKSFEAVNPLAAELRQQLSDNRLVTFEFINGGRVYCGVGCSSDSRQTQVQVFAPGDKQRVSLHLASVAVELVHLQTNNTQLVDTFLELSGMGGDDSTSGIREIVVGDEKSLQQCSVSVTTYLKKIQKYFDEADRIINKREEMLYGLQSPLLTVFPYNETLFQKPVIASQISGRVLLPGANLTMHIPLCNWSEEVFTAMKSEFNNMIGTMQAQLLKASIFEKKTTVAHPGSVLPAAENKRVWELGFDDNGNGMTVDMWLKYLQECAESISNIQTLLREVIDLPVE